MLKEAVDNALFQTTSCKTHDESKFAKDSSILSS